MSVGTTPRLAALARQLGALTATTRPPASAVELAERAGLNLDEWQRTVLTNTAPRMLLNCSRQSGKSTITALLATHTAISQPGSLVLLLSPSQRQSQELFRKVVDAYRHIAADAPAEAETLLRLELDNGSRIVALPGTEKTIRGYSGVRLLVVDEASRVEDALYHAIRPMLAVSGGRLVALSTPWGKRGWWHDEWVNGGPGWERVHITALDCPRIPAAFLEEERQTMPEWIYRSEYLGEFMDTAGAVFRYDDIQAALTPDVAPLFALGVT